MGGAEPTRQHRQRFTHGLVSLVFVLETMAEHLLHRHDVGAVHHCEAGGGVTQFVRGESRQSGRTAVWLSGGLHP
jgi:hypothetical protein